MANDFDKLKFGDIVGYCVDNCLYYGYVLDFGYIRNNHSFDGSYVKIYWFHNKTITDIFASTFEKEKCFKIT